MSSMGARGIETLTNHLNSYFDQFIGIIYKWGGDIIKFCGDALLVIWPTLSNVTLPSMIVLAAQCSLELLGQFNNYRIEEADTFLKLHIGIGADETRGVHVGGSKDRLEFFIAGSVLDQGEKQKQKQKK